MIRGNGGSYCRTRARGKIRANQFMTRDIAANRTRAMSPNPGYVACNSAPP
jgi:hypothetical protein